MSTPREFVPPLWGTRRRTADEWVAAGGAKSQLKAGDVWWPTIGHQVADVGTRLGLPPMPHQSYIFDVGFELDPTTENEIDLWYSEGGIWVMRQCGKTMGTLFPIIVHRETRMPKLMGGRQMSSFTMQDRQETRKKFEIAMIPQLDDAVEHFRRITNPKARPGRSTREWKSSLNNGSEHLLFGRGNYMLIETPSEKAGHGGTLDLKAADEIRFGVDDRIEASAGPSQITRRSRQLWVASTAGDERSWYMWPKVLGARQRIERDDTSTRICSFEWAIPADADLHDPDVWFEHHPAVGHTISVDDILDELRKAEDSPDESKIDTFRQEYANQWIRTPLLGADHRPQVIDPAVWESRKVDISTPARESIVLAWAVDDDSQTATISMAAHTPDGAVRHEVLDNRRGTWWLERRFEDLIDQHQPVAVGYHAGHPPTAAVAPAIARAITDRTDRDGDVLVKVTGTNYAAACEAFVTSIVEGRAVHVDQLWLTESLAGAAKLIRGKSWIWDDQSSTGDNTPIVAATIAARTLEQHIPAPEPEKFYVY